MKYVIISIVLMLLVGCTAQVESTETPEMDVEESIVDTETELDAGEVVPEEVIGEPEVENDLEEPEAEDESPEVPEEPAPVSEE
jgi:hypothetical protein